MRTTIDKAGRVVVPKEIRDGAGLLPGQAIDINLVGHQVVIEVEVEDRLEEVHGQLFAAKRGVSLDPQSIRRLQELGRA